MTGMLGGPVSPLSDDKGRKLPFGYRVALCRQSTHCGFSADVGRCVMVQALCKSNVIFLSLALFSLTSCTEGAPTKGSERQGKYVVLTLFSPTGGAIKGTAQCHDDEGRDLEGGQCLPWIGTLGGAASKCGADPVTIHRGASHAEFVYFPANRRGDRPGSPSNLDIVRCVQADVGFAFSAEIAASSPSERSYQVGDDSPFLSLRDRNEPQN
jgi:hypothetical protein